MNVVLLFPPQWLPYQPPLGMPSLYAFLKGQGIDVVQKDLSIESYEHFLSRRYLQSLKGRIEDRFTVLDTKASLEPGIEQQRYADLFLAKLSIESISTTVEEAKAVFHDHQYFDANTLSQARRTLEDALAVVSAAHFPSRLQLTSFSMPSFDGRFDSVEILTADGSQNPYLGYFEEQTSPWLKDQGPDLIGISINAESQLIPGLTLARLVKKALPGCHIVLGGYLVTLLASVFSSHPGFFTRYFDSLVILEGERPLLELVKRVERSETLTDVPNLIWYDGKTVRKNSPVPPDSMAELPPPDFDGLVLRKYLSPEPVLPVLASRGCYWGKCAFCSHNVSYENRYRPSVPRKVAADIDHLSRRYNVRHFSFCDEAIAPSLMSGLTRTFLESKADCRFSTNIRLEAQFDGSLCQEMYQAGFRVVYIGLESGCDRVLGLMRKGTTRELALAVCRNLVAAGIWDHLYIFLGFPGETLAEAEETISFIEQNSEVIRSFNIGHFSLTRGSAVLASPEEFGIDLPAGDATGYLAVGFDFSPRTGLNRSQAESLSRKTWDRLVLSYPTHDIMRFLSKEDLLVYLSHNESTDPGLSNLSAAIPASGDRYHGLVNESLEMTLDYTPLMADGVTRSVIHFDLPAFVRGQLSAPNVRQRRLVVFNPATRRLCQLDAVSWDILGLSNGRNTIRQISRSLTRKNGLSSWQVEAGCLRVLAALKADSFIV
ncbi:MAG: radical SAM protein [Dehalogenimonas sp.]